MKPILIYGSYGYSGNLIVQECAAKRIPMVLSGRDGSKLEMQARAFNVPFETLDLSETEKLKSLLAKCGLVIHCAGPFRTTAKPMAKACIETKTHYTDITGEIGVFESLFKLNQQAIDAGIMIMPGVGFDVVPTDCMAVRLKEKLPSATHLQLAFASMDNPSRGTAKSKAEGLGYGSLVRQEGKLVRVPNGKTMVIDFGYRTLKAMCFPWGDISTAWRSTGIPNIEVYLASSSKQIRNARLSNYFGWLLRMKWLKGLILKRIDKTVEGPSDERREKSRSYVWGKVWDANGNEVIARLETLGGYTVTAKTAVLIASKILEGNFKPGFATASMAYGANLVGEIEGSKWS